MAPAVGASALADDWGHALKTSEAGRPVPGEDQVDLGVAQELETGSFPAVDPETGEFESLGPRS